MKIELVISDSCLAPELIVGEESLRVVIGLEHGYDEILDLCGSKLSGEDLKLLYRLWSDDDFPRRFIREGDSLIVTERNGSTDLPADGS